MFTPTVCEGSVFFASSPTLVIYGFSDSRVYKCEMVSHCGFDLHFLSFPGGPLAKNISANAGVTGSDPGLGRSPGEEIADHSSILARKTPRSGSLTDYSPWGHKESDGTQ